MWVGGGTIKQGEATENLLECQPESQRETGQQRCGGRAGDSAEDR